MAVKVLVVDDSGFFRRRVTEILAGDPQIQVVGTANNGREAIEQTLALHPDVITMDYEMPVMDGIEAVRQIMQRCPTPVIMFSSLTYEGARVSLDALDAGAADYLPKNFEDISRNPDKVRQLLCERVQGLARTNRRSLGLSNTHHAQPASTLSPPARGISPTPAAPPPRPVAKGQTIQLAAKSSASEAEAYWSNITSRFPELERYEKAIIPAVVGSKQYYRLRVTGPGARDMCTSLKRSGADCFPV